VLRALRASDLADRAQRVAGVLADRGLQAWPVPTQAAVGGGGAPGVPLASAAISLPEAFATPLRSGHQVRTGRHPAVVGRVSDGRLLLDLFAIDPDDDDVLAAAVLAAAELAAAGPG